VLHSDAGETATVQVNSRAQASQVTALHALCVEGWGIGVVVSEDDRRALADGRLVPVLPGWQLPDLPVYAVTPRRGEQPAKVRHALALLAAHFDLLPGPAAG
jgi:DNA-binding transcriptional LysR family regulator